MEEVKGDSIDERRFRMHRDKFREFLLRTVSPLNQAANLVDSFAMIAQNLQLFQSWKKYLRKNEKEVEEIWDLCESDDADGMERLTSEHVVDLLNLTQIHAYTNNMIDVSLSFQTPFISRLDEFTVMHYASSLGSIQVLKKVYELQGCDGSKVSSYGRTALHLAILCRSDLCVQFILETRLCDINQVDKSRSTALHYAAAMDSPKMVSMLIDAGADVTLADELGLKPEDLLMKLSTFKVFLSRNITSHHHQRDWYRKYSIAGALVRTSRADFVRKMIARNENKKGERKSCLLQSFQGLSLTNNFRSATVSFKELCQAEGFDGSSSDVISSEFLRKMNVLMMIGEGSFGRVCLVQMPISKRKFALKTMQKKSIIDKDAVKYVLAERAALERFRHNSFVCQMHFAFQDSQQLHLGLEYIEGASMAEVVKKLEVGLDEQSVRCCVSELIIAISGLHENGVIFRDLKPENIMVTIDGHTKLIDFGLIHDFGVSASSRRAHRQFTRSFCGAPGYVSPEILAKKPHSFPVDWYAIGVLTYELVAGINPFQAATIEEVFENIKKSDVKRPSQISDQCWDFITKLLSVNPKNRLGHAGVQQIFSHPWLASVDWQTVRNRSQVMPQSIIEISRHRANQVNRIVERSEMLQRRYSETSYEEISLEDYNEEDEDMVVDGDDQTNQNSSNSGGGDGNINTVLPYFHNWEFP